MRQPGSDARSKETEFAGLPKAAKLGMGIADNAPVVNVNTVLRFDTIVFNYAGFGFRPNTVGGFNGYDGIVVQEPGVYEATLRYAMGGGGGISYIFLSVNNAAPDGVNAYNGGVAAGQNLALHISDKMQLKAGDIVSGFQNMGAAPTASLASFGALILEKLGGQY